MATNTIIRHPNAAARWALDAGALHLYGFEGAHAAAPDLVAEAERLAREQYAAVCVVTLDEDDRWVAALLACGFDVDDAERTVRNGEVRTELTLIRAVGDQPG